MTFINKIFHFLKKKKYIYGIAVVVLIVGGVFIFSNKKDTVQTILIKHADFINQVSVSGKVIPGESVDLGFSQGGRIASIRAKVGDKVSYGTVIASVDNGDLKAALEQKQAALLKEQANLKTLVGGTRPEQISITESSVASAQVTLDEEKRTLVNTINDAYTKSDDDIKNKIDQFFQNPLTNNPSIVISSNNSELVAQVNIDRVSIGKILDAWQKSVLRNDASTDLEKSIIDTQNNLNKLKSFLAEVSIITNNPNASYSGVPITTNTTWKADTSTARLDVDTTISALSSAVTAYRNAQTDLATKQNNLKLEQAGSTDEDIMAQEAQVKSAQADVTNAQAMLNKSLILAPFDGVISKMDAKVGQIASPNVSLISMMSAGTFQIESYMPEVNIAQIKLGDEASVTLDAYGDKVMFYAKVISIDPAETIRDGVSTYKIKLQFKDKDDRIKSGMTANVSIMTFNKPNVVAVPGGVIFDKDGKKFVQVKVGKNISDREVILGNVSSLGQTEIISGLSDGDMVLLNPNTK